MNQIEVAGDLRRTQEEYFPGRLYYIDVERTSGTRDTLMVFSKDPDIPEGRVLLTGRLKAQYLKGIGIPPHIALESVGQAPDGILSAAEATGKIKKEPYTRTMDDERLLTVAVLETEDGPIPLMAWGNRGRKIRRCYEEGRTIKATGRMQSRKYTKRGMQRMTYELSVSSVEIQKEDK